MPYPDIPKLGDCSASEQKYLQDKVNRAKKEVGKSGKCTGHDCCYILKMKKKAWNKLQSSQELLKMILNLALKLIRTKELQTRKVLKI